MHKSFFISDPHFGHENIFTFKDKDGRPLRSFNSLEDMHDEIITNINERVRIQDKLYILGDVAIKNKYLSVLDRINTKKRILIKGNHDCVDKKTECLTKRGWAKYNELSKDDFVLSLDSNEQSHWMPINDIIIKKANYGYEFNRQQLSMFVTEKHRILLLKNNELEYRNVSDLQSTCYFPISAKNFNKEYNIKDEEIELLAWFMADGYYNLYKGNPYSLIICQSKNYGKKEIERILDVLNLKYSKCKVKKKANYISNVKIKNQKVNHVYRISVKDSKKYMDMIQDRYLVPNICYNFSERQAKLFIYTLLKGDGSWNSNGKKQSACLHGKNKWLSSVQSLCIQNNCSANMSISTKGHYRLNIKFNRNKLLYFNNTNNRLFSKKNYNDIVWCVSTPMTNFMVRRNGKPFFTGNCFKLKDYSKYFKDIRAYKIMPKHGLIFSHIPIHPNNLKGRWRANIHGHLHEKNYDDPRYLNVCVENINYRPIELGEILNILDARNV